MAPIEFEKNIAEKLGDREIQPSKAAWDSIASRLGEQPAAKGRTLKPWMYAVAAGLLLFFGLYQGLRQPPVDPAVLPAGTRPVAVQPLQDAAPASRDLQGDAGAQGTKAALEPKEPEAPADGLAAVASKPDTAVAKQEVAYESGPLPELGSGTPLAASPDPLEEARLETIISNQVDAVLARVQEMEQQGRQVTDAEIDSLLGAARERIANDRLRLSDGRVDAMALLDQAEFELDRSFRDDIMQKLKTGFNRVRLAMAHRND